MSAKIVGAVGEAVNQDLSESFHALVDAVRDAEQRLVTADPPLDQVELVEGYRWIFSVLRVALDGFVWADTGRPELTEIVGSRKKWGGDNSDAYYRHIPIDPARTYRVRVVPGDAEYLSLTVYGGPDDGRYSERIVGQINTTQMEAGPDGAYDIVLSPTAGLGPNQIVLEPDAVVGITRDYLLDPVQGKRAEWSVEADDPPTAPDQSPEHLVAGFRHATTWLIEQVQMCPVRVDPANELQEPYPVPKATFGWAAGDASYCMGSYQLADDEALVVEGRSPECAFWNLCLWNPFLHTYDYRYEQVTLNGGQVQYEDDGSWRIVISATDPGTPNWLRTQGHERGLLWFRWFLPDHTPDKPTTTVVKVADLVPPAAGA
jgi:hypothetical protein